MKTGDLVKFNEEPIGSHLGLVTATWREYDRGLVVKVLWDDGEAWEHNFDELVVVNENR
jgi:hypothetical protein